MVNHANTAKSLHHSEKCYFLCPDVVDKSHPQFDKKILGKRLWLIRVHRPVFMVFTIQVFQTPHINYFEVSVSKFRKSKQIK